MENKDTECIWIEINRTKSKPLVIGSIYRPPDATLDTYLSDIEDQLHKLDHTKTEIAIMGDFNVDMLSKSRPKTKRQSVWNFLLANDLEQVIELPTRVCESSKTLINLFCVNNKHRVVQLRLFHRPSVTIALSCVCLKVAYLNYHLGHTNQGLLRTT